jgi:hypothetical protein
MVPNLSSSQQYLTEHDPITQKTVPWMGKGGGTILFKKEMPYPSKRIPDEGQYQQKPPSLSQ